VPALNRLYRDYRDRVAFHVVYIEEAHPIDAWQLEDNVKEGVLFKSTQTAEERDNVAQLCVVKLGIEMPALVDEPDNRVERAYTGWPDRLYVVGSDGRVAYKSQAGPFGFKPDGVEAVLKRIVPMTIAK
jgi:Iodothyronine deiodinase